ncbi:MAG TPA: hypothetical protein PKI11_15835 [Candidatus Hydrogenedentes bacterium]|nr:hypothetical protein [Candidatus Hydrogenedentota bacterium]
MSGLWMAGMQARMAGETIAASSATQRTAQAANEMRTALRDMQDEVDRLCLLNQALWELLRDRLGVTDADLERVAYEVDMRDGKADGKITAHAVRCPTCGRVSNSKHAKCLYCGQLFEKPMFG